MLKTIKKIELKTESIHPLSEEFLCNLVTNFSLHIKAKLGRVDHNGKKKQVKPKRWDEIINRRRKDGTNKTMLPYHSTLILDLDGLV